jgi:phage baseplate assembly protein W
MAIYSDIDMELEAQSDGDVTRDTETEAVINAITNIINTRQGSRRMLPEFAVNIHDLIFEPMDDTTAYDLGNRIFSAIESWDDRVIIENVNVHQNFDKNQYEVTVDFRIQTSQITETVNIILKQG